MPFLLIFFKSSLKVANSFTKPSGFFFGFCPKYPSIANDITDLVSTDEPFLSAKSFRPVNGWFLSISLPATANATSKTITYGIHNYIKHRKQFKIPINKMEGVRNKFLDMIYQTWTINASIKHTNSILDTGVAPSVIAKVTARI